MQETANRKDNADSLYRPSLVYYHPNAKGTGCAIRFQLIPATARAEGCIMMNLANQSRVASAAGGERTFASFDWNRRLCVKLGFADLCRMMQVFRGECESIGDGKGLYHHIAGCTTRIVLRHRIEPAPGYSIEVYRTRDGEDSHAHILLSPSEAYGLAQVIDHSLAAVCFGVVSEVERNLSVRRAAATSSPAQEQKINASA